MGKWIIDSEYTMDVTGMSLWDIYGSSYKYGNEMEFTFDGSFQYYAATCYGNGSFELNNGELSVELTDGDSTQVSIFLVISDGVIRIALDQYGNGTLVFWTKV